MVSYEDVVRLLLKVLTMKYEPNDNFIQYIIVSILNSLACQVDYSEKRMLGDLGAVQVDNTFVHLYIFMPAWPQRETNAWRPWSRTGR